MRPSGQEATWPYCAFIGGTCLAVEVGAYLGESTRVALLDFILTAGEGARLSLQKNREGFTAQVTEAVKRSGEEPFTLEQVRALRERLNSAGEGSRRRTA